MTPSKISDSIGACPRIEPGDPGRSIVRSGGWLSAGVACVLLAVSASSQGTEIEVLRAERTASFYRAWDEADADRRDRATEVFQGALRPGSAVGRRPELETLAQATRALLGSAVPGEDRLQRFADSIDLAVIPGAFSPSSEGRGRPMTVRVLQRYPVSIEGEVRLSLIWRGPAGEELESHAETFGAAAFRGAGFPMYVRSPVTGPGLWHLAPLLEQGETRRQGALVPVECIEGVERRYDLLRAGPLVRGEGWKAWMGEFEGLMEAGRRWANGVPPSRWLARKENGDPQSEQEPIRSLEGVLAPELEAWGRLPQGLDTARDVFVLFAPFGESAAALFHGPLGRRWEQFAERRGADLISVRSQGRLQPLLAPLVARLRSEAPDRRIYLVGRGDGAAFLQFALFPDEPDVNGLVLCSPITPVDEADSDKPWLIVSHRVEEGAVGQRPGLTLVRGRPFGIQDELDLPGLIENWLLSLHDPPPKSD